MRGRRTRGRLEREGIVTEFGEVNPGVRIVILLLLLIVLTLGGIVWFDYLGVLDAKSLLSPVYRLFGVGARAGQVSADDPNLLERERLGKLSEAISLRQQDQDKREADLLKKERELNQLAEDLKDRETAEQEKEKAFNDRVNAFENRRVNLVQNSRYLTGMPPKNAVDIMLKMDDQDIIDIFRITEQEAARTGEDSPVAYWLSQMPADRAATLERKMAR
jgi:flagellar protein FlbB